MARKRNLSNISNIPESQARDGPSMLSKRQRKRRRRAQCQASQADLTSFVITRSAVSPASDQAARHASNHVFQAPTVSNAFARAFAQEFTQTFALAFSQNLAEAAAAIASRAFTDTFTASHSRALVQTTPQARPSSFTCLPIGVLSQIVRCLDVGDAGRFARRCKLASKVVRTALEDVWEKMLIVLQDDIQVGRIKRALATWSMLLGSIERLCAVLRNDVVKHWEWILEGFGSTESILWRMGCVLLWKFGQEEDRAILTKMRMEPYEGPVVCGVWGTRPYRTEAEALKLLNG